jgi:hypothetical protein
MISKEQTYVIYIFQNNPKLTTPTGISLIYHMLQTKYMFYVSEIKLCENEVEDVLKVINPTKASGPDLINDC